MKRRCSKPWTQAAKLCWEDRVRALGDPDFVQIPIADLLSDKNAQDKAHRIQRGPLGKTTAPSSDPPCTANVSIIDAHGNAVSLTATQGAYFGSHVVIPGLGLVMNHGMSRFDFPPAQGGPGNPNVPLPGDRRGCGSERQA